MKCVLPDDATAALTACRTARSIRASARCERTAAASSFTPSCCLSLERVDDVFAVGTRPAETIAAFYHAIAAKTPPLPSKALPRGRHEDGRGQCGRKRGDAGIALRGQHMMGFVNQNQMGRPPRPRSSTIAERKRANTAGRSPTDTANILTTTLSAGRSSTFRTSERRGGALRRRRRPPNGNRSNPPRDRTRRLGSRARRSARAMTWRAWTCRRSTAQRRARRHHAD